METGQNCVDCISAKATATRSTTKIVPEKVDPCKNCGDLKNSKTSSRDEKVSRQIRQLFRKNNNHHHINGFSKPTKDLIRSNGLIPHHIDAKKPKTDTSADKASGSKSSTDDLVQCNWLNCERDVEASELMNHLREAHVKTQNSAEMFVCLWQGCKVYDKSSCSYSWLERHVLSHSGAKPFECLFDGCGLRLTSHSALERHINTHFKHINNVQQKAKAAREGEATPEKKPAKRKRRKKKIFKEVTGSDYFDGYTLDGIRLGLYRMERSMQIHTNSGQQQTATFQPTVICRREEPSGAVKHLTHWSPQNVLPDTWLTEGQVEESRDLELPLFQLPKPELHNLDQSLYRPHRFRKHRRK